MRGLTDNGVLLLSLMWLVVVGAGALILRRELGLMRGRVAFAGTAISDGLEVGAPAPASYARRSRLLLFLFGDCAPCHEVVQTLDVSRPDLLEAVALDGAQNGAAESLRSGIGSRVSLIEGADAEKLRSAFAVTSGPLAIAVTDGIVTGKGYIRRPADLEMLLAAVGGPR